MFKGFLLKFDDVYTFAITEVFLNKFQKLINI
jgi:hypothetical protein